jgi:hypothetical protein
MIRNIKILSLALLAALSISAAMSAPAQAVPTFEVPEPAILEATVSGEKPPVWASGSRSIECPEAFIYTSLTGNVNELTVDPKEYECEASFFGKRPAEYTSNHCEYIFQNMTTAGSAWTATMDILCENVGEEMQIHVYENEVKHEKFESICTVGIPPQQNIGTVVFSNMTGSEPPDITINFTLSSMQFNVSGPIFFCGTSSSQGTYTGVYTMHAENLKGTPIPLGISGE